MKLTPLRAAFLTLLLACAPAWAQGPPSPDLEIERLGSEVIVRGVTPGAELALLGVGRSRLGYRPLLETWPELLVDADGDGQVTLASETSFPELSAWGAVDLASGAVAILEVPDLDPLIVPLRAFAADGSTFGLERQTVEVLWARPGTKARAAVGTIGDGGSGDGDGKLDRRVTVRPGGLHRLAGVEERGLAFAGGDVVIVVDSLTLEMAAVVVPATVAAPTGAAGGVR